MSSEDESMSAEESDEYTRRVDETTSWPDLGIALYDRLTGRGAEIEYEFEDMTLLVPSKVGEDADHAHWEIDGTLRIRTSERD